MSQENQLLLKEYYGTKNALQLVIKNFGEENNIAEYYMKIFDKFSKKKLQSILEIHPFNEDSYQIAFRKAGYDVQSINLDMRINAVGGEQNGDKYIIGSDFNFPTLKQKFDAIIVTHGCFGRFISLEKSGQFLKNIHQYLDKGGLLIFEFWHLPGIERDVTDNKGHKDWEKVNSASEGSIMRFTNSKLHLETSVLSVDIHYVIEKDGTINRFNETNAWRLYTLSELDLLLNAKKFQFTKVFKFPTFDEPEFSSFRLLCICEKNS